VYEKETHQRAVSPTYLRALRPSRRKEKGGKRPSRQYCPPAHTRLRVKGLVNTDAKIANDAPPKGGRERRKKGKREKDPVVVRGQSSPKREIRGHRWGRAKSPSMGRTGGEKKGEGDRGRPPLRQSLAGMKFTGGGDLRIQELEGNQFLRVNSGEGYGRGGNTNASF